MLRSRCGERKPSKRRAHLRHGARRGNRQIGVRNEVPAVARRVRVRLVPAWSGFIPRGWRLIYLTFGANLAQREAIKAGRSWKKNESTHGPKSTNLPMCRRAVPL